MSRSQRGFTIVELLIVIVVIGILAALVLNAYTSVQIQASATKHMTDIKAINSAIFAYNVEKGGYPNTGNIWVWASSAPTSFVPDVVPAYISSLPKRPGTTAGANDYIYRSDGVNYKLLSHYTVNTQSKECLYAKQAWPSMTDTGGRDCWAFGYWSSGAASW